MHEMAIAEAVVQIACVHAGGRRIAQVELKVGALRQVVPSALEFSFEIAAQGTAAEGAELAMEEIPARVVCRACEGESRIDWFPLACGRCGGFEVDVVGGEELLVDSLEVVNEDEGSGAGWKPALT